MHGLEGGTTIRGRIYTETLFFDEFLASKLMSRKHEYIRSLARLSDISSNELFGILQD